MKKKWLLEMWDYLLRFNNRTHEPLISVNTAKRRILAQEEKGIISRVANFYIDKLETMKANSEIKVIKQEDDIDKNIAVQHLMMECYNNMLNKNLYYSKKYATNNSEEDNVEASCVAKTLSMYTQTMSYEEDGTKYTPTKVIGADIVGKIYNSYIDKFGVDGLDSLTKSYLESSGITIKEELEEEML